MFHTDQARRLRQAVAADASLTMFEDQHLGRCTVLLEPSAAATMPQVTAGCLRSPGAVFGEPFDRSCLDGIGDWEVHAPVRTVAVLRDATIIGTNGVIDGDGRLFAPEPVCTPEQLERALHDNESGYQGFAMHRDENGEVGCVFASRPQPRRIPMRAFFFHNLESANYGSFMFRQLPQMILAREQAMQADCYVTVDRMPWLMEAIELLSLPPRPVFTVREICGERFDTVYLCNDFDAEGFVQPATTSGYRRLSERSLGSAVATPAERIYLSRGLSGVSRRNYRHMNNELAVEDALRQVGFQVIYPETMTFRQQIAAMQAARHVIGPSGSAMFNVAFAPEGVRVLDIETFHWTVRQHAKFYSSQQARYAFLFADMDPEDEARHPISRRSLVSLPVLAEATGWLLGHG